MAPPKAAVEAVKEIAVRVSLKNNLLRTARRALGLTVERLCEVAQVSVTHYYAMESFREPARRQDGSLRPAAARICEALGVDPATVFPLDLDLIDGTTRELLLDRNELQLVAAQLKSAGALGGWQPMDPETALEMKEEAQLALSAMTRVQAHVTARVAAEESLGVLAEELGGICPERVRQIAARGYHNARLRLRRKPTRPRA